MIVLDASVLIAYFAPDDSHHKLAQHVLATNEDLGINSLTLAEVLVRPAKVNKAGLLYRAVMELEVVELPLPSECARPLAQLRADTGLKLPDCCVLLTAEHHTCSIATFDKALAQCATSRGVVVRPPAGP